MSHFKFNSLHIVDTYLNHNWLKGSEISVSVDPLCIVCIFSMWNLNLRELEFELRWLMSFGLGQL